MIHNLYWMQSFSLAALENQLLEKPLWPDTHKIISYVSATIFDASTDHVLHEGFYINYLNRRGFRVIQHYAL